jgi:hypothetical protein
MEKPGEAAEGLSEFFAALGPRWLLTVRQRQRLPQAEEQPRASSPPVVPAERMPAYVAVTRARLTLDRAGLAWADECANAAQ